MQGNSLRDSHRKNKWTQSRTQHSEYRERLHFWSPTPPQGPSLWGRNLSIVQAHYLGPHKLLPSPSLAPESLSDASTTLDHSTGQALFRPPRFWPAQPPSHSRGQHYLWSHSGVAEEELEEGGIWWKSTCQPETLLGENTVHALRQSSGVGGGAGHRGAQNEFPASRGWEVWHPVLPSLLCRAHSLQFLLRWSHGSSLE